MDEDEEFEDYEFEDDEEPAYHPGKIRWIDPFIVGVQVVEEVGAVFVSALGDLKSLMVMHANYQNNRDRFAAEAGRELEKLLEE